MIKTTLFKYIYVYIDVREAIFSGMGSVMARWFVGAQKSIFELLNVWSFSDASFPLVCQLTFKQRLNPSEQA